MDIPEKEENPIDSLRASIEKDYKFKTSFSGFDKAEVKKYLAELEEKYDIKTAELEEQTEKLKRENEELAERSTVIESPVLEMRQEERRRLEAQMLMQEGIAANLRQTNARLVEENRRKDIEIADLKMRMDLILGCASDGGDDIVTLCASLQNALESKVAECEELIAVWRDEAEKVITSITEQIRTENGREAVIQTSSAPSFEFTAQETAG